jgi:hypothetical protein
MQKFQNLKKPKIKQLSKDNNLFNNYQKGHKTFLSKKRVMNLLK